MKIALKHFTKTVTTAGTRERLTTLGVKSPSVSIQALRANTNVVFVGNNQVSSTNHFISLAAGGTVVLGLESFGLANASIDLSQIWLDVTTSGEGVMVGFYDRPDAD